MTEFGVYPIGDSKFRNVHFVYDEDQAYMVREFYEAFKDDLPQLIYITQGQYALTELETFSAEQLIRIHNIHLQKRVVAHTNKHQKLSIPLDYPHKFCVVKGRNQVGEPEFLQRILDDPKVKFPIMVQFAQAARAKTASVSGQTESVTKFGIMTLSEVYEETFLIGNCLNLGTWVTTPPTPGWLCKKVILMPLYLSDVLVARVTGLEEGEEKWQDLLSYMDSQIRTVSLADLKGNPDLAVYTEESEGDHVYDYIRMSFDPVGKDEKDKADQDEKEKADKDEKDKAAKEKGKGKGDSTKVSKGKPGEDESEYQYVSSSVPNDYQPFSSVSVRRKNTPPALPPNHPSSEPVPTPPLPPRRQPSVTSPTSKTPPDHTPPYVNGEDIDVSKLTIEELCQSLIMLKLEKYTKSFKKKGVDGRTLVDLIEDKEGMMKDFNMKATDFIKLRNYVRDGHIPR